MNDVIPNPSTLRAFSVSELSFSLKMTLEETFSYVRVKGEVSGTKIHSSGHIYFSLKDEQAVLDAICWRGTAQNLAALPEDGLEVVCSGKITTYPGRSKYQIIVDSIEAAGQGALLKLLEERKKKLAAEGLFDASRKKSLPFLPRSIGIITSPTGAVIRDILHRLADRMPTPVILWPVSVQGQTAASEVARAIKGFNALPSNQKPDLLIVARGGGSLEDLWAFNEEEVVRAAAVSEIPLISAVGHETDTTLIDYASDYRAPTPTAAAERAVPVREDLLMILLTHQKRMLHGSTRLLKELTVKVESLARGIPHLSRLTDDHEQRLDDWYERLRLSLAQSLSHSSTRAENLGRLLESFSYQGILQRGFTLIRASKGSLITHKEETKPGMGIEITFQDGVQKAVIEGQSPAPARKRSHKAPKKQMDFWS